MSSIVIFGSSASNGHTRRVVEQIIEGNGIEIVDLKNLDITPFDYEHKNKDDDYHDLMKRVVKHDCMVLVTPIYWYTMSAHMKIFIDRLTDLFLLHKDTYNKLQGKKVYVITTYANSIPSGFEEPFSLTCDYMGMQYEGCAYIYSGADAEMLAKNQPIIKHAQQIIL